MELIRGIHNLRPRHAGCVLTIGNFDGIHRGHQAVLTQLKQKAAELKLPSCVMVFEPQPLEFFYHEKAPARLNLLRDKCLAIRDQQIDRLLCIRFDQSFAQLTADQFIEDILVNRLNVRFLVIGDDFRFGVNREGDFHRLQAAGKKFGFAVLSTATLLHEQQRVSSTLLRTALQQSDFDSVEKMLGHPYAICGRVVHGAALGRTIGFPTANIVLKRQVAPLRGVFAVKTDIDGQIYQGVANIGFRPTVNGTRAQLEAFLFDFQGDLYGRSLQIQICHKLRDEQRFPSFDALKNQIIADAEHAKAWFAAVSNG